MPYQRKKDEFPQQKSQPTHLRYVLVILFVVLVLGLVAVDIAYNSLKKVKIETCGDGTFYGTCSLIEPYYCEEGALIEKASVCGCGALTTKSGESCISKYQTNPKEITLNYILRGEEREINFRVYGGMDDYISQISRAIYYDIGERPSRADFKLKSMNEEEQRQMLLPLVAKIQNITDNEEDQVRIAVSLVQHIPYGTSEKIITIGSNHINYSRYPYEVLYDNAGICGEKSALLAFFLREMGYGTVFFYHAGENHESIGIKCPVEQSLGNTGYCFVETTAPSIITDDSIVYVGGITLDSEPEVILVSKGKSIDSGLYEYKDADTIQRIRESYIFLEKLKFGKLTKKYGLVEEYHSA